MRPFVVQPSHERTQHLFLHGLVCEDTCLDVYAALVKGPRPPAKSFTLHINSPGGDCDSAFSVVHAVLQSPACVTTVGAGTVCSAALDIFISGHVRNMARSTTCLLHCATVGSTSSTVRRTLRNIELKRGFDLWSRFTKLTTREAYDEVFTRRDRWVTASDLYALGAVDNLL